MIGTRGVPARYGGFEAAVEEVGKRLVARGHEVVVYCRNDAQTLTRHLGMELVNLPALRGKYTETLSHTALSVAHAVRHPSDVAIMFNAANAPLLPWLRLRRIPVALHVDGLEWKRPKWSGPGRQYYLRAEWLAVRSADRMIADARAIQDYYFERHGVATTFIPYGAPIRDDGSYDRLAQLGLEPDAYHLVVARMEPENNVHVIVEGYVRSGARLPLVVVGSAPYAAEYEALARAAAVGSDSVRFVGSVWDQTLLDQLYANARLYLHGHSVGGTNPSLLRAMGAAAPVAAFDVVFNREVLGDTGVYFGSSDELQPLLREADEDRERTAARGLAAQERAGRAYDWERVAEQYERLCLDLLDGRRPAEAGEAGEAERRARLDAEREREAVPTPTR
jgi:glycosyltransferase involved in cell wall biosynthesis